MYQITVSKLDFFVEFLSGNKLLDLVQESLFAYGPIIVNDTIRSFIKSNACYLHVIMINEDIYSISNCNGIG